MEVGVVSQKEKVKSHFPSSPYPLPHQSLFLNPSGPRNKAGSLRESLETLRRIAGDSQKQTRVRGPSLYHTASLARTCGRVTTDKLGWCQDPTHRRHRSPACVLAKHVFLECILMVFLCSENPRA